METQEIVGQKEVVVEEPQTEEVVDETVTGDVVVMDTPSDEPKTEEKVLTPEMVDALLAQTNDVNPPILTDEAQLIEEPVTAEA